MMAFHSGVALVFWAGAFFLVGQSGESGTRASSSKTISVDLVLRTGGSLSAPVVDSTDHGLVVVHNQTPYVFSWEELEPDSAYQVKAALMALGRGGDDKLTGEDYFRLGLFAYRHGLRDQASACFERATRLDRGIRGRVGEAVADAKRREKDAGITTRDTPAAAAPDSGPPSNGPSIIAPVPLQGRREEVRRAYEKFGVQVQEVMGKGVSLIETDHFLIWTDWKRDKKRIGPWCEAMYAALCDQFGLDRSDDIFLAKCPIYCWRSKKKFQQFARHFDGFEGAGAIGYTRSIAENGHVHVVLLRQGRSAGDLDRFASTLVHEGTHAFLHRLYSSRLIPHWVNEGYADLVAERVLGDRSPAGENAELLAKQIVRYDWPLGDLLKQSGPIRVDQYPIAHSVVAFLEQKDSNALAGFIRALKSGMGVESALDAQYGISTVDRLETHWRQWVRTSEPGSSR